MDEIYRWYPIYIRSRAEKKAAVELTRKNIECYLPLRLTLKQWSDRKKLVEEPLLKSYLFVYISAREYTAVLSTSGVSRFLYFSGKIAAMPTRQIEELRLLLASDRDLEVVEYDVIPGEKVLVKAGPFKGIVAELVSLKSKNSLILRLQHLGCAIHIKTSMAYIEPMK